MPDSTLAGVITAIGTLVTASALVITAIGGFLTARRIDRKVETVHSLVNQQHTDLKNYQRTLIRALEDKGITVPIDQSVEEPPSRG